MKYSIALCALIVCLGCGRGDSLFPLAEGKSWTFTARNPFITYVEPLRVTRKVSVADTEGFELAGPMGACRLAWKNGVLYADSMINSTFSPPLPIAVDTNGPAGRDWSGEFVVLGWKRPATASLTQSSEKLVIGGKSVSTIRALLMLHTKGHEVEVITWYAPGRGPVRQEQRTDKKQIVSLEAITGG